MLGSSATKRKLKGWAFIILLLSDDAAAVRTTVDIGEGGHSGLARHGPSGFNQLHQRGQASDSDLGKAVRDFKKLAKLGDLIERKLTCESLVGEMQGFLDEAHTVLDRLCNIEEKTCAEVTEQDANELIAVQLRLNSAAATADYKHCLANVMASSGVQENIVKVLSFLDVVLEANQNEAASLRLNTAFHQLRGWQEGTMSLSDAVFDRSLMLSHSFNGRCPTHCEGGCERLNGFTFRCVSGEATKDRTPSLTREIGVQSFTCTEPVPKPRKWSSYLQPWLATKYQKDCEVVDWRDQAVQQVHVSAMLHCGTSTILIGLMRELSDAQRHELHDLCVRKEQGVALTLVQEAKFSVMRSWAADDVVPHVFKLGFGIFASLALASGMAALRQSSKGNRRTFALLQESQSPDESSLSPHDYLQPFDRGVLVNDAERSLYSQRSLVDWDAVLAKMEECEDVFEGKNVRLYSQATRGLVGFTMSAKKQMGTGYVMAATNIMEFPVVFASAIGTISATSRLPMVKLVVGMLYIIAIVPQDVSSVSALLRFFANQASGRKASTQKAGFEQCWANELGHKQELISR